MRIFEIILLISVTVFPIVISIRSYSFKKKIPLIFICCILIIHLAFEGLRWQMIPAYLIIIILIWCLFKELPFFRGGWLKKTFLAISLGLVLILAWLLPYSLPVFNLPTPSGKFNVGSQYFHLKTDLDEIISTKIGDKRELMIKIWYPATIESEKTEPYLNDGDRISFAVKYSLPKSTFNYLDYVKTHTFTKPAVANGSFPILIFSHGSYSQASGYYAIIEEIVSHGYIVLNINHTYESTGTLFPNGEIKLYDSVFDKIHNNEETAEMIWIAMENYKKAKTSQEEYIAVENLTRNYYAGDINNRWSKNVTLVIDELEKWNTSTFLKNHIDTSKIGVFGHSQGGSAAANALLDDDRIKAGLNLDGAQWGKMIDTTMTKPFAVVSSDWSIDHMNINKHAYRNGSTSVFYYAKILNSGHSNFMDIPLMINIPPLNEAGSIHPYDGYKITTDVVVRFFDTYLLEKPSDLLDLNSKYPELKIELRKNR